MRVDEKFRSQEATSAIRSWTITTLSTLGSTELLVALILTSKDDDLAYVAPLSSEVRFAGEWDLLIDPSFLGYPVIAELWNPGWVLVEQLRDELAVASPNVVERVKELLEMSRRGAAPAGDDLGPAILSDNDPRGTFHELEADRVHPYWEPYLMIAGAETVGDLIRSGRETGNGPNVDVADAALDIEALERDEAPLLAVPHLHLARLLEKIGVRRSRRVGAVIRHTIDNQRRVAGAVAKTGATHRLDAAADADREVDVYVRAVLDALPPAI